MGEFPTPTDAAYIARLRGDYPDVCDGKSDEWVMDHYNPDGCKYVEQTLWDHLGDAGNDYERLADAYLKVEAALRQARPYVYHATVADSADLEARYSVLSTVDAALTVANRGVAK